MAVEEKPSVREFTVYKPAATLDSVAARYGFRTEDIIKLAANESRFGPSPKVKEALDAHAGEFSNYPDMYVTEVRQLLAEKHHVGFDNLVFGNGSFELISMAADAYLNKGEETIYAEPSFGWYLNATRKDEGIPVAVPVNEDKAVDTEAILAAVTDRTKIIWICNPNNPTGTLIPEDELRSFLDRVPDRILVVLDEAYLDFAGEGYFDTTELIRRHDNLLLLRTFSKAAGLASFRFGYGIAGPDIIRGLEKVRLPINTSMQAQLAAEAALRDPEYTKEVVRRVAAEREFYYREFERVGFGYVRSFTNFILVHTGIDGDWLEQEFLKHAIMIRSGTDFGLREWIRLTVGTEPENRKVIAVLDEILAGYRSQKG